MSDKLNKTQRILRSPKVTTDERGRTVWTDPVETAKLELVSTQMLEQIIEVGDIDTHNSLRAVAEGKDGLLVRDIDKGHFEVIGDQELQHILDGTEQEYEAKKAARPVEKPVAEEIAAEEELELVSTQMLRIMLSPEDEEAEGSAETGFNPYDHR